jgi:hypothetical protein
MLGGPQSQSGMFEDKNELLLLPGIEPRIIQPVAERFLTTSQTTENSVLNIGGNKKDLKGRGHFGDTG